MEQLTMIEGYRSALSLRDTQKAIKFVKDAFQSGLAQALNLERISAPLIVRQSSGLNDDLNGVERKVDFDMKEIGGRAEVVQSLAKWKRVALKRYGFSVGEGLYTDMNAIRRDDDVNNDHSICVDQWDWEKVIRREDRNLNFLQETVRTIAGVVADVKEQVRGRFPTLTGEIRREVYFVTSQELEDAYPGLTPKEREAAVVKEHKTVFVMQIGGALKSGRLHDGRAPDYDDWSLNGDLLFWNEILEQPIEITSMGVRVDADALRRQLQIRGNEERMQYAYHQGVLRDELPLTVGGGIGQSRLCMLLLEKLHIGEVLCSIWPEETERVCREKGIQLL
ncbi:MAG: aspartate--ammonia ligase [Clostridiales bacterium]|nr:aspartate--ammonia ligase [Clostridiales bacterium]